MLCSYYTFFVARNQSSKVKMKDLRTEFILFWRSSFKVKNYSYFYRD